MPVATCTPGVTRYSHDGCAGIERKPTSSGCCARCDARPVRKHVKKLTPSATPSSAAVRSECSAARERALAKRASGAPNAYRDLTGTRPAIRPRSPTHPRTIAVDASRARPARSAMGADRVRADARPGEPVADALVGLQAQARPSARRARRLELDQHRAAGAQQPREPRQQRASGARRCRCCRRAAAPCPTSRRPGCGRRRRPRCTARRARGRRGPRRARRRRRARGRRGAASATTWRPGPQPTSRTGAGARARTSSSAGGAAARASACRRTAATAAVAAVRAVDTPARVARSRAGA